MCVCVCVIQAELFDPVKMRERMRQREAARQDIKAAHKAVVNATQGERAPLRGPYAAACCTTAHAHTRSMVRASGACSQL